MSRAVTKSFSRIYHLIGPTRRAAKAHRDDRVMANRRLRREVNQIVSAAVKAGEYDADIAPRHFKPASWKDVEGEHGCPDYWKGNQMTY